ncbi:MAG: radical SAM/SPASM domain-containing protein, partial [Ignavibacteriales bacterium]
LELSVYNDLIETICLSRDGEPTLDKHLSRRVKMLKDAGIKHVTFSTNGQLLIPKLIIELIDAGLDDIMVSIDGITKATFEEIRRGLDFETVVENTKKLIELRDEMHSNMTIRIRMVANPLNLSEADEWMAHWEQYVGRQDRVYVMPMHTWGNQIELTNKDSLRSIKTPCVSPFSTMIIHADGSVGLCGVDYSNKHLLGHFPQQSIKDIWQGEGFLRVRELHAMGKREEIDLCVGCDLWDREYKELE